MFALIVIVSTILVMLTGKIRIRILRRIYKKVYRDYGNKLNKK